MAYCSCSFANYYTLNCSPISPMLQVLISITIIITQDLWVAKQGKNISGCCFQASCQHGVQLQRHGAVYGKETGLVIYLILQFFMLLSCDEVTFIQVECIHVLIISLLLQGTMICGWDKRVRGLTAFVIIIIVIITLT